MAPCSPSSGSQVRAAGPSTWRPLSEQLDQPSQWTLACPHLLRFQMPRRAPGARKRLPVAPLLRCREVGATACIPEVTQVPVSPSLWDPAGKGGDRHLASISLLLSTLPHLLSELIQGSLIMAPRLATAGGCWPGQAAAATLCSDRLMQLLLRNGSRHTAGGVTAPECGLGWNCPRVCLSRETPTCILGTKSAECVTFAFCRGISCIFHLSPHPLGLLPSFYLE